MNPSSLSQCPLSLQVSSGLPQMPLSLFLKVIQSIPDSQWVSMFEVRRNSRWASGQQEESSEEELPSSKCFGPYFLTLYESGPHPGHDSWVSSCCFCLRWGSNPVPLGGLTVPKVLMVPSNPAILSTRPWEPLKYLCHSSL